MHFEKVLLCRFFNLHQLKNTALNLTSLAVCFVFFFCTSIKSHWFFQLYWQRNCFFLKSNLVVSSFASYITTTLLKGLCVVENSNVCSSLDIVRFRFEFCVSDRGWPSPSCCPCIQRYSFRQGFEFRHTSVLILFLPLISCRILGMLFTSFKI